MNRKMIISICCLVTLLVALLGVAQSPGSAAISPTPEDSSPVATAQGTPFACHVTLPNGRGVQGSPLGADIYGNGYISAAISRSGIFEIRPSMILSDGSLTTKVPWWWAGVKGYMFIEGHRLDAPAPPLQATGGMYGRFDAPTPTPLAGLVTGDADQGFAPSGLIFPTEGCWQITGRVGDSTLTFIAVVDALPVQPVRMPSGTPSSS